MVCKHAPSVEFNRNRASRRGVTGGRVSLTPSHSARATCRVRHRRLSVLIKYEIDWMVTSNKEDCKRVTVAAEGILRWGAKFLIKRQSYLGHSTTNRQIKGAFWHPTIFNFDENSSIGLYYAQKTMVTTVDSYWKHSHTPNFNTIGDIASGILERSCRPVFKGCRS